MIFNKLFINSLLFISVLANGQDSLKVLPKRYIKLGPHVRIEAEWKRSEKRSKNVALNAYFNLNYYNGFKIQYSERWYWGNKNRFFWAGHVGVGYIKRVTQYRYKESVVFEATPIVTSTTEEIRFKNHKWFTAGIGTGIGYQQFLGKKRKWLVEASAGIQYYYYHYRKEETSTLHNPDGSTSVITLETSELDNLWEKSPFEEKPYQRHPTIKGIGTPFSLLYLNVMLGHSF